LKHRSKPFFANALRSKAAADDAERQSVHLPLSPFARDFMREKAAAGFSTLQAQHTATSTRVWCKPLIGKQTFLVATHPGS
jgi:hypothetical protein